MEKDEPDAGLANSDMLLHCSPNMSQILALSSQFVLIEANPASKARLIPLPPACWFPGRSPPSAPDPTPRRCKPSWPSPTRGIVRPRRSRSARACRSPTGPVGPGVCDDRSTRFRGRAAVHLDLSGLGRRRLGRVALSPVIEVGVPRRPGSGSQADRPRQRTDASFTHVSSACPSPPPRPCSRLGSSASLRGR